ncbi:unnamed protein product [Fraxinus pennsylvanica]|uniref:C2H2-type domain-containing protein n=1 Tax=Fraxinus pennsylvanica TaxID=56036 RepID=A0AAD1YUL9_9LAMI|nr:unnamed protein product [Fraxinus pennsylvanica]
MEEDQMVDPLVEQAIQRVVAYQKKVKAPSSVSEVKKSHSPSPSFNDWVPRGSISDASRNREFRPQVSSLIKSPRFSSSSPMPNNRRGSSSASNASLQCSIPYINPGFIDFFCLLWHYVPSTRELPRPKTLTPCSKGWIGFGSVSKLPSSTQVLPSTEIPMHHNPSSTLSRGPRPNLISSANTITPYQLSVKNQVPNQNPCPRSSVNVTQTHSSLKRKAADCDVNITNNSVRNLSCDLCQVSCSSALTLQQHVKGRTHQAKLKWMQLNRNGKEQSQHGQPRCDVCKIFCTDKTALYLHLTGKKHKAKLHELELRQKNGGENGTKMLWCELCHVPCMNEDCFKSHLKGKKHIAHVYNVNTKMKIEN